MEDYNEQFDKFRKNRVEMSHYKYGPAKINFSNKLVDAIKSMELCLDKYKKTKNTEYLLDAANYLMFEFTWPQLEGAFLKLQGQKTVQV